MPTNDDTPTIDSVLGYIDNECIGVSYGEANLNYDKAEKAIQNLIDRARLDELRHIDWYTTNDSGYHFVKDRIKALQARIKEGE